MEEDDRPKQLTFEVGDQAAPTWSHDGRWIYFTQEVGRKREVWRVGATGGAPTKISHTGSGVIAFESPDGHSIVHTLGLDDSRLVQTPIDGGEVKPLASCTAGHWGFSVVGEKIYYMACGAEHDGAIRAIDASGRDRLWAVVPDLRADWSWDPAISPDGTTMIYNKVMTVRSNLWMIDNFR